MKILNVDQIRQWDAYTIQHEPIASVDLMERASVALCRWIIKRYAISSKIAIFAGPGNNGGDALALGRLLFLSGFQNIDIYILKIGHDNSDDFKINYQRLTLCKGINVMKWEEGMLLPFFEKDCIAIDGIFGSGLSRSVIGYWGDVLNYINQSFNTIVSIDIPSGLFADNSIETGSIINASITLTFQNPKLAFFFAENFPYTGYWEVLDIELHPSFIEQVESDCVWIESRNIKSMLKLRRKFDHKGTFGHALLVAGSFQKTGAAVLSAKACLRSGVGLLTVHVPQSSYDILQTSVPEAMLCIDETECNYCSEKRLEPYTAIGMGPGIGVKQSMQNAFYVLLRNSRVPLVLDADALNILALNALWLNLLPPNTILTPHPGEFDRLTCKHETGYERWKSQLKFAQKYNVIVVLKGAHSSIVSPKGQTWFNSSGNPGMATAGSGDVLTGIILSLLAQGYLPLEAAICGVFLHGLSGDIAASKIGEQALIASDIIDHLGEAFNSL